MGSPTFLPPLCERCLKPASDEIHGPVETCRENGRGWCNEPWVHHAFRPERDFGPLPPTPPALRNDAEKYADLRDAAKALMDNVDSREKGLSGYYIDAQRFVALRAALAALGGEE